MRQVVQNEPLITLEAQGRDAREVFAELFRQAGKPFVLHITLERPLYLALRETPFPRALQMLCEATDTRFSVRDGVYLILPRTPPARPDPSRPARTVRLVGQQMPLQQVVRQIETQAGVRIEMVPGVPQLRFNLNLPAVEVEAALEALCKGTGLRWERTSQGYRILAAEPPRLKEASASGSPPAKSLRSPAVQPRSIPARAIPPDRPLKCPQCNYSLQLDWRYCPLCGAWVKPLTERAKREGR
ncbi:MAG: zinc ribbon domain-containing protein [Armatimonadota bacterium]